MIPVTVRLSNPAVDRHITQKLSDLSYRLVARGGFASASFWLHSPISITNPLLAPFTRVYIYDARTAETLWEGRLAIPGRSASDQGQVWALTAIGPSAHASDESAPLIYLDTSVSRFKRMHLTPAGCNTNIGEHPGGTVTVPGLLIQFPSGQFVTAGIAARMLYDDFNQGSMTIGAFGYAWDTGMTDTDYKVESVTGTNAAPTAETVLSVSSNTAGGSGVAWVVDDFPADRTRLSLRLGRPTGGAGAIGSDTQWVFFYSFRILGRRMKKDGTLVSGGSGMQSSIQVTAAQVVEDLLGRMLPQYDGANAVVSSNPAVIDQLSYPDGVTAAQVLDDLMKLAPAYWWGAWESNAAGLYRFTWTTWPLWVRYEATVADGFDNPAATWEQYNRIKLRWLDVTGRAQTTMRTQTIPEMDAAGVIREYYEDLSDEVGTANNAIAVGDAFLAEHRYPPAGGTLTVARPVHDLLDGRRVWPWQIRPGELIRVRGIEGSVDSLNASDRDGQTVFRIVSVTVNGDGTAVLELDVYTRTEARALVDLHNKRKRKR